jgi:hypothetical protein
MGASPESALKAFGEGFHVYQYLFKSNRPEILFASYDEPLCAKAVTGNKTRIGLAPIFETNG